MNSTIQYNTENSSADILLNLYAPIQITDLDSTLMSFGGHEKQVKFCKRTKRTMYQRNVDVDMLNAVKSVLARISSVSPSSELFAALAKG